MWMMGKNKILLGNTNYKASAVLQFVFPDTKLQGRRGVPHTQKKWGKKLGKWGGGSEYEPGAAETELNMKLAANDYTWCDCFQATVFCPKKWWLVAW